MRPVSYAVAGLMQTGGVLHKLSYQTHDGRKEMKREKSLSQLIGEYSGMAFVLPVSCLVGYAIGYYLDQFFGTRYLYLVFLFLGIASGFLELYRQVTKNSKEDDEG